GGVVWATAPAGTVNSDGATIDGDGVANPLNVPTGGITTTQIEDGTIISADIAPDAVTTDNILDANVTPIKIQQGAVGQVLTTDASGVVWATAPTGAVNSDGATVDGDGVVNPLNVPEGGITTTQIL